jgi:hypothetical protein
MTKLSLFRVPAGRLLELEQSKGRWLSSKAATKSSQSKKSLNVLATDTSEQFSDATVASDIQFTTTREITEESQSPATDHIDKPLLMVATLQRQEL